MPPSSAASSSRPWVPGRCLLLLVQTWPARRILGGISRMGEQGVESPNLVRQPPSAGTRRFVCAVLVAASGTLLWPASSASAAPVVHLRLVQTIRTSAFSPPSPDPSGIVYMPGRDRLLISDSEVDE